MNYTDLLWQLIEDKAELKNSNSVCLSLREISEAWKMRPFFKRYSKESADLDFIQDIDSALKRLEKDKKIKSISYHNNDPSVILSIIMEARANKKPLFSELSYLSSPQDKICLEKIAETVIKQNKNRLASIYLITKSLNPTDVIFMVLDEHYKMPIRFNVKNRKGEDTGIRKLYNIAYIVSVPNTRVEYNKNTADAINNGLFKRREVTNYMRTNNLKKPTLVQISENKDYLVLKNEVVVKTSLLNTVPTQYKSLYIDKTM
jgi:hypothetical protein